MVDWKEPIEAVHATYGVQGAKMLDLTSPGGWHVVQIDGWAMLAEVRNDGFIRNTGWRIRNVAKPTSTRPSDELVERMVALLRGQVASLAKELDGTVSDAVREARSIMAELEPVDPDEEYAANLLREQGWTGNPTIGSAAVAIMIAQAYRAGRQLEKGEG